VVAHGNLLNRKIDKELAKEVLKDMFSSNENQPAPEIIKKYVCKHFNIKLSDIESPKRARIYSYPRQIAMYICRSATNLSLPKIGEYFGNRDHTTVLHACEKIHKEKNENAAIREILEKLEYEIRSN
jgi:chromosomal replication initiator protein